MAKLDTTTLQYLHRRAPFFAPHGEDLFLIFLYWKGIVESGAVWGWTDRGSTSNLKLPFFKYKLSIILSSSNRNVNIFSEYVPQDKIM